MKNCFILVIIFTIASAVNGICNDNKMIEVDKRTLSVKTNVKYDEFPLIGIQRRDDNKNEFVFFTKEGKMYKTISLNNGKKLFSERTKKYEYYEYPEEAELTNDNSKIIVKHNYGRNGDGGKKVYLVYKNRHRLLIDSFPPMTSLESSQDGNYWTSRNLFTLYKTQIYSIKDTSITKIVLDGYKLVSDMSINKDIVIKDRNNQFYIYKISGEKIGPLVNKISSFCSSSEYGEYMDKLYYSKLGNYIIYRFYDRIKNESYLALFDHRGKQLWEKKYDIFVEPTFSNDDRNMIITKYDREIKEGLDKVKRVELEIINAVTGVSEKTFQFNEDDIKRINKGSHSGAVGVLDFDRDNIVVIESYDFVGSNKKTVKRYNNKFELLAVYNFDEAMQMDYKKIRNKRYFLIKRYNSIVLHDLN